MANPAGRYAGYYRGAPGSNVDPNREFATASPTHDCVSLLKSVIASDATDPVKWSIDFHAARNGGRAQLGVRTSHPVTMEWDTRVRALHGATWTYYDAPTTTGLTSDVTIRGWMARDFAAPCPLLIETCDGLGSISPAVMRPYAEASVNALAGMDAEGWFDPPAVELSGAAVSISTATGTLATSIQLAGSAASLSTAGGDVTAQITLSGAALAQAAATAALTAGAADLAGDAHATAEAIGTLTTQIRLSGAAVSQALAGADLTTESAGLSGSAQASATAMGLLGTGIPLVGEATATASAAGSLGVPILLSGAAAAVSSATGELTIALALEGHSLASALASGSLTTHIRLSGAALGRAAASGALAGTQIETPARRIYRVRYPARIMRVTT